MITKPMFYRNHCLLRTPILHSLKHTACFKPPLSNVHQVIATYTTKQLKTDTELPASDNVNDKEQQYILDLILNKDMSVFITGSAGTGKTTLLKKVIVELKKKYPSKRVQGAVRHQVLVTATTGTAAVNIGGTTYHRALGLVGSIKNEQQIMQRIMKQRYRIDWEICKVLIIDEISMMSAGTLDLLDRLAKNIRQNDLPFGGIQVVLSGDFFQLPPVVNTVVDKTLKQFESQEKKMNFDLVKKPKGNEYHSENGMAFNSASWNIGIHKSIALSKTHRQSKDEKFAKVLNITRICTLSTESKYMLRRIAKKSKTTTRSPFCTALFGTREEADRYNDIVMLFLPSRPVTYFSGNGGFLKDMPVFGKINKSIGHKERLTLKRGAYVMVTSNYHKSLLNGTTGTVVGFKAERVGDTRRQQDQLHDEKNPDFSNEPLVVQFGIEDIPYWKFPKNSGLRTNKGKIKNRLMPVIEIYNRKRKGRSLALIKPMSLLMITQKKKNVLQWSVQLPLINAWGLTIHKAQGKTYRELIVDLKNVFAEGQSYVGLSRVTSREGLSLFNYVPWKSKPNKEAVKFYNTRVEKFDKHGNIKKKKV